jgi:predicted molibdopterin-dependent oxidoreductase YjgC
MTEPQNQITINGHEYVFQPDETILSIARRSGIDIPTLCYLKRTIPTGACRICVVEVKGARSLMPSCSTPAAKNMIVFTESAPVIEARRLIIQLLLSSGNHNCDMGGSGTEDCCPVCGACTLQDLAYRYQVKGDRFPKTATLYPPELDNPFIIRDFSRCILCGRCVQACNEVQVNNAISIGYRGSSTKIIAAGDRPLKDSDCVFCGECVQACPVGALVEKSTYKTRDWKTKKVRTTCSYCGVGCQLYLHVHYNKVVKVTGVEDVPPNFGSLCVKGRFGYDFINSSERLTSPLIKENGEFRKASWDEALSLVAGKLGEIKEKYGPDSIGVLTSARITNEENYIVQKFARAALKTNNIDHCARL